MALSRSAVIAGRASRSSLPSRLPAPLVALQSRQCSSSGSNPEYSRLFKDVLREKPLVKRWRKWWGSDQPLYDLHNYPNLPRIHQSELPTYGWYDNYDYRNKNTLIHDDHEALSIWVPDTYAGDKRVHIYKQWHAYVYLVVAVSSWVLAYYALQTYFDYFPDSSLLQQPRVAKLYPHGNLYVERGGHKRFKDGYFPSGPADHYHPNNFS